MPKLRLVSDRSSQIRALLDQCTAEELNVVLKYLRERTFLHPLEREWGTKAETILTAIARSSDLTQRGVRGILAEASFEEFVLADLEKLGWKTSLVIGDRSYDFVLEKGTMSARIQVKLQRKERGNPKEFAQRSRAKLKCPAGTFHVVEVQKTRSGKKGGEQTRPYRFGDFDILAVSLHPSTGDWQKFMYTVGSWLLPRPTNPELIAVLQPVPTRPDFFWTNSLEEALDWFRSAGSRRLYS